MDDQRLMDQIYAIDRRTRTNPDPESRPCDRPLRHHHHRQRRRRRHDGAGAGATPRARILILERGDFVPQEDENWNPEAVWKHLRYRIDERWLDERGREFRPTRTTASAATRSSGAACSTGSGARISRRSSTSTASRRPGRSTTTRSSRTTTAPSGCITCAAQHGVDPDRAAARPVSVRAVPHAPGWRPSSTELRALGLHPSPLPLGLLRPGEADGCILCNTCNSFPCKRPREERRRRLLRPSGARARRTSRCGPTRTRARLITDAVGPPESKPSKCERNGETRSRRGAARDRRRAARSTRRRCCCARRATRIRTASRIRRASSARATWRTSRR